MGGEPAESGRIPERLARNLRALAAVDAELAERLTLPVRGSHVCRGADGVVRRQGVPLEVPAAELERMLETHVPDGETFVFGLGLGEPVECQLASGPRARLIVWERDPWLVRLALGARDLSGAIRERRLVLRLGVDLLDELPLDPDRVRIVHPVLRSVYDDEWQLLELGVGPRRVALGSGGPLCAGLAAALRVEGFSVLPVDLGGWAREEISRALARLDPELVVSVGYLHGLAEFCQEQGRRLLCWEVETPTDRVAAPHVPTESTYLFSYRRAQLPVYQALGFRHVEHLPIGADTQAYAPVSLSSAERLRYGVPIAVVPTRGASSAAAHRRRFLELFCGWHPKGEAALSEYERVLDEILEAQCLDPKRHRIPELVLDRFGSFVRELRERGLRDDPIALLTEVANIAKLHSHLASLGRLGLHVWGEESWRALEAHGVRWRSEVRSLRERRCIFHAAAINVEIAGIDPSDVPLRVFEVLACGGFLIAERTDDLEELFRPGVELESFTSLEELQDKARYYLEHAERARAIAARGLEAVRARHSLDARLRQMLDRLGRA
ncbi:MAG: glycosyltransferase [Myxococcota bacterium]